MVSILNVPLDENSSFLKGCAKAPQKIIKAFYSSSSNEFSENNINVHNANEVKILDEIILERCCSFRFTPCG